MWILLNAGPDLVHGQLTGGHRIGVSPLVADKNQFPKL
jgi:hypothetical protein